MFSGATQSLETLNLSDRRQGVVEWDDFKSAQGVIVSGSPGIGKSVFGVLLIAWFQQAGIPVLYKNQAKEVPIVFFSENKARVVPGRASVLHMMLF